VGPAGSSVESARNSVEPKLRESQNFGSAGIQCSTWGLHNQNPWQKTVKCQDGYWLQAFNGSDHADNDDHAFPSCAHVVHFNPVILSFSTEYGLVRKTKASRTT